MGSPRNRSDRLGGLLDLLDYSASDTGEGRRREGVADVSEGDIETFIDLLRALDMRAFESLVDVENNPGFRKVLKEVLKHGSISQPEAGSSPAGDSGFADALEQGQSLVQGLVYWRERVEWAHLDQEFKYVADSGVFDSGETNRLRAVKRQSRRMVGPEWDQHWGMVAEEWEVKRGRLSALLREAADLYESGQAGGNVFPYPSLENSRKRSRFEGLGAAYYSGWGGAEALRSIARRVDETPLEILFPAARPRPLGWVPGQVGRRGGASDINGALRGMVVREIANLVPGDLEQWQGYAAIARLATVVGLPSCSPQYVRALLHKGRT